MWEYFFICAGNLSDEKNKADFPMTGHTNAPTEGSLSTLQQ